MNNPQIHPVLLCLGQARINLIGLLIHMKLNKSLAGLKPGQRILLDGRRGTGFARGEEENGGEEEEVFHGSVYSAMGGWGKRDLLLGPMLAQSL